MNLYNKLEIVLKMKVLVMEKNFLFYFLSDALSKFFLIIIKNDWSLNIFFSRKYYLLEIILFLKVFNKVYSQKNIYKTKNYFSNKK
jgi:hypothetical protein